MVKFIAPSFVIISCLMHLFCCGIPLLLSVTSLSAILGLSFSSILELEWFEVVEQELMIASGVILVTSIAVQLATKRLNCHDDVGCCDAPCTPRKSFLNQLVWFAGGLYLVNILTVAIA